MALLGGFGPRLASAAGTGVAPGPIKDENRNT